MQAIISNGTFRAFYTPAFVFCLSALSACGGGGGSSSSSQSNLIGDGIGSGDSNDTTWEAGVFLPAETFANRCESPRTGIDPSTNATYADVKGSTLDENYWLRSWSNDLYLWYSEIEDRDPEGYSTEDYFDLLKSTALTMSGTPKDQFHFAVPTDEWIAQSQSGASVGYGLQWSLLSATPPRKAVVAYTAQEDAAGLPPRGAEILEIDGYDIDVNTEAGVNALNAGLFPSGEGEAHNFVFRYPDNTEVSLTLTAGVVISDPVQNVKVVDGAMGQKVGYMLFNDHIATAEKALVENVSYLESQGIDELVLDLRYNGGGYLAIASQLSYMIAGETATAGRIFESLQFNDQHPETNPVTGEALVPAPFYNETLGFSAAGGEPLPTLDLTRVFVITGSNTCSASESIINSLRGIDVEVVQIGGTTCGKPYGFYPEDNCGTTYFSIQFQGVNDKGFGDYADGFTPNGSGDAGVEITGCPVGDDFGYALGDVSEARFATALNYINSGSCSGFYASSVSRTATVSRLSTDGKVVKNAWRENRIYVR
ncbi:S41 family peptidase [Microbulbifer aggregans]|uniref:S41 family peptidase n=1 Tax=Microbulbifer aggregans TaxID=1769779 RepID=UPI001CFE71AC|nr:S41 family peptidase [Microbulbifer aggregans]